MTASVARLERPRHSTPARVIDALRQSGMTVSTWQDGPLGVHDLVAQIQHAVRTEQIGPDSPVMLEDPKYATPWVVRAVRFEDGRLLLDVWG